MKNVLRAAKKRDAERALAVLKLEVDYELATLFEAINENNEEMMKVTKERLEQLRQDMIKLGG